jgi:hypothetical protein
MFWLRNENRRSKRCREEFKGQSMMQESLGSEEFDPAFIFLHEPDETVHLVDFTPNSRLKDRTGWFVLEIPVRIRRRNLRR